MKRIISCILLLIVLTTGLFAAPENAADVVVLLDTSTSVIPYFDLITDNILCGITRNYIKSGDTFHLISFGTTYKLETAQTIQTRADIESIVSRFMLLYPLDSHTDFLSALQYTNQYISALRVESQKSVVIITDGIQDPAPESSVYGYSADQAKQEIKKTAERMKAAGWNIYYIRLPLPAGSAILTDSTSGTAGGTTTAATGTAAGTAPSAGNDADGTPANRQTATAGSVAGDTSGNVAGSADTTYDLTADFADSAGVTPIPVEDTGSTPEESTRNIFSLPTIECDSDLGKQSRSFTIPLRVTNPSSKKIYLELNQIQADGTNILKSNGFLVLEPQKSGTLKAKVKLPETIPEGRTSVTVHLEFAGNQRTNPQDLSFSIDIKNSIFAGIGAVMPIVLIIIAVILLLILLLIGIKKLAEKTGTANRRSERKLKPVQEESGSPQQNAHSVSAATATVATASAHTAAPTAGKSAASVSAMSAAETTNRAATAAPGNRSAHELASGAGNTAHKNDTFAPGKPEYGALTAGYAKNDVSYDENATRQAAANQQGVFTYTLKKDAAAETAKRAALFAAANPNERIDVRNDKNAMLELYVYNQSRMIGKRNIHIVKPGKRYSIGGGQSNFLIFLVKFPQKIAELRYDGETCSLAIFKPEYFPNETQAVIENCIDRDFCIISEKGYPVTFKVREYEDPVEKYNRLVQSIKYD